MKLLFQKTGKANYAILSQLPIIFEIPDDNEHVDQSWKDNSDNYQIRGLAIQARMNTYNSGNWQKVCSAEQRHTKFLI